MVINSEVLQMVAVASFVLAKLVEVLKERLAFWAKLSDAGREYGGYGIMAACGVLMWSTGYDMFPGFNEWIPVLGRVLTCVAGALGPSLVYDILLDKPEAPQS